MGKYFGTDGFRGEANVKLTVDHAFKVGRYVGCIMEETIKLRLLLEKIQEEAVICLNMHLLQV